MENTYFKYCMVPLCKNTSVKTPTKIFIRFPKDRNRRLKWLKACRREEKDISDKSSGLHVCEDHFNLEEDMENYIKFKLVGGPKKMKPNAIPHIFDCQPDRKRAFTQPARSAAVKRVKRRLIDDAIASTSTSTYTCSLSKESLESNLSSEHINESNVVPADTTNDVPQKVPSISVDSSVQVRPRVRSKSTQCSLNFGTSVGLSPFKIPTSEIGTTPTKPLTSTQTSESEESPTKSSSENAECEKSDDTTTTYSVSDCSSFDEEIDQSGEEKVNFKNMSLNMTITKLKNRPRLYMGLPEYSYYTFQILEKFCKLPSSMYIFLTLKKIKTGLSFVALGDDFGTSESNASRIFARSLPIISKYLRKLIITPDLFSIKSNLPLAFRARYSNVLCIIDCLEIEIEKPSDAIKQSLTWSEYKKCNTLKYLIACTPDGIINFISSAFGGRASDATIVEYSGFLNILPSNVGIMADRGFKHVEHLLISKGCALIRPPSVSKDVKSTKEEVFETKRIASLRIHVERVVRRLREFSFLAPHACIDNKLIPYTDQVVKVVCGLVNLQSGIISGR